MLTPPSAPPFVPSPPHPQPPLTPRNLTDDFRPPATVPRVLPSTPPVSVPRVPPTPASVPPITPAPVPRVMSTPQSASPPAPPSPVAPAPQPARAPTPPPVHHRFHQRQRTAPNRYTPENFKSRAANFLASQESLRAHHHHIALATQALSLAPEKEKLPSLHKFLQGPNKNIWSHSSANELGRLLPDGVGKSRPPDDRIEGTSTIFPIRKHQVPPGRKVTYVSFVCDIRPQKKETHRTRMVAGCDKLDYPGDPSSPAVSVLNSKLMINSILSDASKGAEGTVADISNFYLGSSLKFFQYIRVLASLIPQEIFKEYKLHIEKDG